MADVLERSSFIVLGIVAGVAFVGLVLLWDDDLRTKSWAIGDVLHDGSKNENENTAIELYGKRKGRVRGGARDYAKDSDDKTQDSLMDREIETYKRSKKAFKGDAG